MRLELPLSFDHLVHPGRRHLEVACEIGSGCVDRPQALAQPRHRTHGLSSCHRHFPRKLNELLISYKFSGEMAMARRKRSEEHTSELQSLMRSSYAVFCLKKKKIKISTQRKNTKYHYTYTPVTI